MSSLNSSSKDSDDLPKELPDPNGPFSNIVPPSANKMANHEERAICLWSNRVALDQGQTGGLKS